MRSGDSGGSGCKHHVFGKILGGRLYGQGRDEEARGEGGFGSEERVFYQGWSS